MSEFDETDFDELNEDFMEEESNLTPEEIFKMVLLNKVKGTAVHVELFNSEGEKVELADVIEKLLTYVEEKLSEGESNPFVAQIMPLMAQSVVSGLGRMLGIQHTAFYLANETSRIALINMMAIAFLLLKYIQQNELTIQTFEEEIAEEEIEEIERKASASSTATMGALVGIDPKTILENLVEKGEITQEDLDSILNGNED